MKILYPPHPRHGVSITELIVAMVLLGIVTSAVGQFVTFVNRALESREMFWLLQCELENAREQIGSWHPQEITQQRIVAIPFSPAIKERFRNLAWSVEVRATIMQELEQAPAFQTVRLGISAELHDQSIRSADLYFWVPANPDLRETLSGSPTDPSNQSDTSDVPTNPSERTDP